MAAVRPDSPPRCGVHLLPVSHQRGPVGDVPVQAADSEISEETTGKQEGFRLAGARTSGYRHVPSGQGVLKGVALVSEDVVVGDETAASERRQVGRDPSLLTAASNPTPVSS